MLQNDLKNDIEKTLQAHCPEPPEGFAERMDNKAISLMQKKHNQNVNKGRSRYRLPVLAVAAALVLCFVTAASRDLIIRPDAIRARETATPLVTALSEGHGEIAEGESLSQEAIEALEVNFPGVADKLKPVNLSCEKQGIRMNVISALVEGNESWVVYSLQDLEGDRLGRQPTMDDDLSGNGDDTGYYCYLEYKQEDHKVTCVHYEEYDEPYQPVDNHLAFKVEDIGKNQITKIDLLPFLEKYGKTSDGVKMPDEAFAFGNKGQIYSTANMKVLDDSDSLNVSLYKDIYLTGIGWIDGKLHVRIQDRQQEKITIGSMSVYPAFLSAAGYFPETGRQCEMDQVEWSSAGDERKDLKEYIFDVRPDEVDKMELEAWGEEIVDVVKDSWEVQIPADSILAETEEEPSANIQNESDEQIEGTLWAFFTDWVGQDTEYLLNVCADEWKNRQSDPEQAARELMASRKPDGYIINNISGKDGDPVRMVDVTVRWDADTYRRHEIPFRLQQITPAMEAYCVDPDGFGNRTAAEPVPENELVLLTEEEIIRKAISYPDLSYDDFIPLNLGMEKQGIRMEVISGCVKGQDLYILCSLQDLEGRYDGLDMEIEQWFKPEAPRMGYSRPYSNYAENKSFWLFFIEQFAQYRAEDGTIPFGIDLVRFENDESFNILPFLEKYGKETEGVNAPENARLTGDGESTENLKVLDYTNPLDVPLTQTAKLTGIGWINNQLHVQMHAAEETIQTERGTSFPATTVSVYDPFSSQSGYLAQWDENGDWFMDWYEFVLDIRPENAAQRWICAEVRETKGVVDDNWEVQVPIDMLLPETGVDTAVQEEAAAAAEAWAEDELKENFGECLWWFFRNWKLGNTDYVTEAFRYDWNTDQADPEESAKEIMKAGTPGGYKIQSVSGKLGDPDCKADVTVLWQERESSYTCTRHELEFWLEKDENGELQYAINPEGFKTGSAVDDFPDNPVLMREGDIIRDVMDAHIEGVSYDELIPISGLSTEKQGIRLEAVSGCVKGNKAYVLYALQDVEGKYDGLELNAFTEWHGDDDENPGHLTRLYMNRAENKSIWLYEVEKPGLLQKKDSKLTFGIDNISIWDEKDIDLTPYLKECDKNAEGIELPEVDKNPTIPEASYPDVEKILDYKHPLDISLWEGAKLTGIGWIDGRLHVQVQCTQDIMPIGDDEEAWVEAQVNLSTLAAHQYYRPLEWRDTSDWSLNGKELVLDVKPEDMEQSELTANIRKQKGLLKDNWELQVPISMLLKETGADTAVQEEAAETANPLALEEEVNRKIEEKWPGITKELKPVNLSCEKQGIRLAVSSVVMKENKSWFVFSLEDLEGSRIKQDTGSCFNMFNLNGERNITASASWEYLYYDESKHKIAYAVCMEYDGSYQSQDNDFIVQIEAIGVSGKSQIDLLPFLKEYGNVTEGVEAPAEAVSIYDFVNRKDLKVLDYKNPLDVELGKDVYLAGIGWIDDQLHVQIYDMQPYGLEIGQMYTKPLNCSVNAFFPEQINNRPILGDIVNLKNDLIRRDEYIFDVSPDETDNMVLYADMTEVLEVLRDNWEVRIPLESILAEGEDTTNQETAAPSV